MAKRVICIVLAVMLTAAMALPALAKETEAPEIQRVFSISRPEDLLLLAENCRLDTYSENLRVILKKSIDMTGSDFTPIPIFCGTFEGRGHTISGITLTGDGSYQGLFRYISQTGLVRKLRLEAHIDPQGSRTAVGGLAGENAGKILDCSFTGVVTAGDRVGGIAGSNTLTGVIEGCTVQGVIAGNHMVGGIAGENAGVIRGCESHGAINTTAQQNQVSLSDISLDTLAQTEFAATVTDVGGIAGASSGVITDCTNRGDVGYRQMGYNIGGIAGRQNGTVLTCRNFGNISGRKEVGGIVGHLEPAAEIEYDEDVLQILERQLKKLKGAVNQASSNVSTAATDLTSRISEMSVYIEDARDAAGLLVPDPEDPELPDMDTLQAARNGLSSSLANMTSAMENIGATAYDSMSTLGANIMSIQNQVGAMGATLGNTSEAVGGRVEDVSNEDTGFDLSGKISGCENYGNVQADVNIGGITGAIALQSELDAAETIQITGSQSLNFVSKVRAVVRQCKNYGKITSGKQHMGGIAGYQTLGLIRESENTASVGQENAQYVGGVVGNSTGYVRENSAKCHLAGSNCVGGIAGSGTVATDCRAMVEIEGGQEKLGAILGTAGDNIKEVEDPIGGNLYTYHGQDPGGIDGISYAGKAEGIRQNVFLSRPDTPELFRTVTVAFRFADGTEKTYLLKPGTGLQEDQIPPVPEVEGFEGFWEGMAQTDISHIDFDLSFDAVYESDTLVIASAQNRDGLPLLLVQGNFQEAASVTLTQAAIPVAGEGATVFGSWDISITGAKVVTSGRLLLPEAEGMTYLLRVQCADGTWQQRDCTENGSYLVFAMDGTETGLVLTGKPTGLWKTYAMAGAAAVLAVGILAPVLKKRRK